jgi:hypothetical protein
VAHWRRSVASVRKAMALSTWRDDELVGRVEGQRAQVEEGGGGSYSGGPSAGSCCSTSFHRRETAARLAPAVLHTDDDDAGRPRRRRSLGQCSFRPHGGRDRGLIPSKMAGDRVTAMRTPPISKNPLLQKPQIDFSHGKNSWKVRKNLKTSVEVRNSI